MNFRRTPLGTMNFRRTPLGTCVLAVVYTCVLAEVYVRACKQFAGM